MRSSLRLILALLFLAPFIYGQSFDIPEVIFSSEELILSRESADSAQHLIIINEAEYTWPPDQSEFRIVLDEVGLNLISIDRTAYETLRIPGWLSILPPLIAILLALIFRQVIVSLIAGIWIGAFVLSDFNPFFASLRVIDHYIINALVDADHMSIIVFSMLLGGMVGIVSKNGGAEGIVTALARYASNRKRGQFFTALMGTLIFFDDYANTLIVGNTMRPLADRLKISREKLAYIVDSTAAPVVSLMFISTWIGYEVSLVNDAFITIGYGENAYIAWLQSVPYRFYAVLALALVFIVSLMNRDFGPMLKAEERVALDGVMFKEGAKPLSDNITGFSADDTPKRWFNAIIPIISVIVTVFISLYFTGYNASMEQGLLTVNLPWTQKLSLIIGNSDSFAALLWASAFGVIVAAILSLSQRILSLHETIKAWLDGMRAMLIAVVILTLAWGIGSICAEILTAKYVVSLTENLLAIEFLPALVFIISGIVAFATGTSWGTMAIVIPIVMPLANELGAELPAQDFSNILYAVIASVLSGAVFGDHCSPISDTTIMSSMASGSDHIDHVRTQLPYSMLAAGVAILIGYLPVGWGVSPWIGNIIGILILITLIRIIGKRVMPGE